MKLQQLFNVVPRPVRVWATVIFCCATPIGLLVGYLIKDRGNSSLGLPLTGLVALGTGAMLAVWLLCVGFVYADARSRNMRAVPWALVVIFVPHLLGFLFYFVMRQPVAACCSHCGGMVSSGQRFCPSCGGMQATSIPSGMHFAADLSHEPKP